MYEPFQELLCMQKCPCYWGRGLTKCSLFEGVGYRWVAMYIILSYRLDYQKMPA